MSKDAEDEIINEFDYTYDAAGQLTSETDMQAGLDGGTPWTLTYTADAQGQLTGDGTNTYDYDLGGNRDTGNTYYQNPDEVHFTNEIETDASWHYYYDGEGNVTEKVNITEGDDAGIAWVYDNANRTCHNYHRKSGDVQLKGTPQRPLGLYKC